LAVFFFIWKLPTNRGFKSCYILKPLCALTSSVVEKNLVNHFLKTKMMKHSISIYAYTYILCILCLSRRSTSGTKADVLRCFNINLLSLRLFCDFFFAVHILPQHFGYCHRPVGILIQFQNWYKNSRAGDNRIIKGVAK